MSVVAILLIAGAIIVAAAASAHAVLYKRDVRAATAWAGFIWVLPYGGAVLYWLFGVNPWGVSMVIGLPKDGAFARDPHSVVAKQLAGMADIFCLPLL